MKTNQLFNSREFFIRIPARQRLIAAGIFLAIVCFFGLCAFAGHYGVDLGKWFGRCGFKQRYDLPCPTCGYTTALMVFAQGRIVEAFYIQPAAAFLYLLLSVVAVLAFIAGVFGVHFRFVSDLLNRAKAWHIILTLLLIMLAGWAVTLTLAITGK